MVSSMIPCPCFQIGDFLQADEVSHSMNTLQNFQLCSESEDVFFEDSLSEGIVTIPAS